MSSYRPKSPVQIGDQWSTCEARLSLTEEMIGAWRGLATCTAKCPTPPAAPFTSTVLPSSGTAGWSPGLAPD